jgi:AMP-binding enzyme C-terminal domain
MFPRKVEELLITHLPIADAAAIGIDGQRLRAFAVRRRGRLVRAAQLQASVENNLARYKVTARGIYLDELPRNPTDKILKPELAGTPAESTWHPVRRHRSNQHPCTMPACCTYAVRDSPPLPRGQKQQRARTRWSCPDFDDTWTLPVVSRRK